MKSITLTDIEAPCLREASWPEGDLEKLYSCPLCGETGRETLYEGLTDRVFFCAPGEWTLDRCLGCHSAYLDPRPTCETIALAYRRYFTHKSPDEGIAIQPKRGGAGLKIRLRYGYLNQRYKLMLQPASALGRWIVPWFPARRGSFERGIRNMEVPHCGARLLDVGCGNGEFLRLASRIGWDPLGLETDATAAEVARATGFHVRAGHLPDTGLPSDSFDAVTLSHVIEHLHAPIRSLQEVYRVLAPGGRLWIATPNLESPLHRRFRRNWLALDPPRHLLLYNLRSLVWACRRSGFESVTVCNQSRTAEWMTAACQNIERGEDPFGQPSVKLKWADRFRALGLDWAAALRPELGEELVVLATKPTQ